MGDRNTVTFSYMKEMTEDAYHFPELVWNRPSVNQYGSMPLGNGDIGINLWVEEDGDLLFHIAKTDSYSEDQQLLKLGRVRVHFAQNPFTKGQTYRQILNIQKGIVEIEAGGAGSKLRVSAWVDANHPVIRVRVVSNAPVDAQISLELWRTQLREVTNPEETHSYAMQLLEYEKVHEYPDTIVDSSDMSLLWCHRNETSFFGRTLDYQHLGHLKSTCSDPLLGLTFGCKLSGQNLIKNSPTQLVTKKGTHEFSLDCVVLTKQTKSADEWIIAIEKLAALDTQINQESARRNHEKWWTDFWERSHIQITGSSEAEIVARGYQLQRYMHGCQSRGSFPIKFNGGLFTTAHEDEGWNPDYRLWGGSFWIQNTRLNYWPMLMDGDFDLMHCFFDLYQRNLPVARERAKLLGAEGAIFPETMTIFGACNTGNYGYDRPKDLAPGLTENTYIRRYWQGSLEISSMMLDYYQFTGDGAFARDELIPFALEILRFYKSYYSKRDDEGKILFSPSQSLETWHMAVNPTPDIAGLIWLTKGLLQLESNLLSGQDRAFCEELAGLLPPLPTRSWHWTGKKIILPALVYDQNHNWENPELYAVFPYRLYGIGKTEIERGVATFHERLVKQTGCWMQDAVHAAMLGLTEEAKRDVVKNFSHYHAKSRFPAYWDSGGHNFDWIPDQDHGGVTMIAVQRMLMQCDDGKIHLLPAWPKDWDVNFKLHAPDKTIVEGVYRAGKLLSLTITPEARRKDVVMPESFMFSE